MRKMFHLSMAATFLTLSLLAVDASRGSTKKSSAEAPSPKTMPSNPSAAKAASPVGPASGPLGDVRPAQ